MASISVRRLPQECMQLLRQQALKHGVSMEEEVRQILLRDLYAAQPIGELAIKLFRDDNNCPALELPSRETFEPVEFR